MLLVALAMFGDLLLRLALHAEHPRLLGRPGRRRVPADDDADHPDRADRRQGVRPIRLALADDRRDGAARRAAALLLARSAPTSTFWNLLPGLLVGGARDGADDDADARPPRSRAVPVDKSGVGSAVLNAMRQVGGSVGIALMGAIVADRGSGRSPASRRSSPASSERSSSPPLIAFAGSIVARSRSSRRGDACP